MTKLKQSGLLFFLVGIIVLLIAAFFFQDSNITQAYPPPEGLAYVAPSTAIPNEQFATASTPSVEQYYLPGMHKNWVANPKKGLAYSLDQDPAYIPDAQLMNFHWYHNWDTFPEAHVSAAIATEFIPFVWCKYSDQVPLSVDYDGYVLFFNEPDEPGRECANHLPSLQDTALEYVKIKYLLPKAKLIGPHISHEDDGEWISLWRQAVYDLTCDPNNPPPYPVPCGYPDVAGYGFHHYNGSEEAEDKLEDFCNYMKDWGELDKELWITEFGFGNFWPNPPTRSTQEVIEIVEVWENGFDTGSGHCEVNRYAYFNNRDKDQPIVGPGTPEPPPETPDWYTDLYCRQTYDFSHTGEGYNVAGNLGTSTPAGQSSCTLPTP